jgi:hypothetical protein
MELSNKQSAPAVETANDNLQTQLDLLSTQKVERVRSFREYAFEKAGLNRGDYLSMKANLQWIKDGHLVDETYNEKEEHLLKQQVKNKIIGKDEEKEKVDGEKRTSIEVSKPSIEKKIKDLNDEIQQTKLDLEDNKIETGYQPEKYFMYAGLTVLLSFYLLFFYASAIYASFFRNAGTILKMAGDDIALYLDSIFDVKGIFTASPVLLIVYLGAFLFFAIGLIFDCNQVHHLTTVVHFDLALSDHLHHTGVSSEEKLLTGLSTSIERTTYLSTTERSVIEVSAVLTSKRNTLGHHLIDNIVRDFGQAINVGFTRAIISALNRIVEKVFDRVTIVWIVLGCIDPTLSGNRVSTASSVLNTKRENVVTKFGQSSSGRATGKSSTYYDNGELSFVRRIYTL